jgi:hypothetical protein
MSGAKASRFGEIAVMVQPWSRDSTPGDSCGNPESNKTSSVIDRVDLWYTRDPRHTFNPRANDCREGETVDPVWYGSYFMMHCDDPRPSQCGGYFLNHAALTGQSSSGLDEMVFALTSDTKDPNQLPHRGASELIEMFREANVIVGSIKYNKIP